MLKCSLFKEYYFPLSFHDVPITPFKIFLQGKVLFLVTCYPKVRCFSSSSNCFECLWMSLTLSAWSHCFHVLLVVCFGIWQRMTNNSIISGWQVKKQSITLQKWRRRCDQFIMKTWGNFFLWKESILQFESVNCAHLMQI